MKHTRTTRRRRVKVQVMCCILFVRIRAGLFRSDAGFTARGPEVAKEGLLLGRGSGASDRAAESR